LQSWWIDYLCSFWMKYNESLSSAQDIVTPSHKFKKRLLDQGYTHHHKVLEYRAMEQNHILLLTHRETRPFLSGEFSRFQFSLFFTVDAFKTPVFRVFSRSEPDSKN